MRRLRLLIMQFAAFTLGTQIMVVPGQSRRKNAPSRQDERDACIQALLEAIQVGDVQTWKAQARVMLNLPTPEIEDFKDIISWSFHSQEWMYMTRIARDIVEHD